ncbi:MAG: LysM peptidoglycan-binding domain-containing protein, partial [Lysobacteraceae bacterium]
ATHTVARGESAWSIARRYGLRVEDLLARNHLLPRSVLRPGTVLQIALAGE